LKQISLNKIEIIKVIAGIKNTENDLLAIEEPLEIKIATSIDNLKIQKSISVTMRTPANDAELALGFLYTEGLISNANQVLKVEENYLFQENVVLITLQKEVELDLKNTERNFYTTSSCGVCGKSSIDAVISKLYRANISTITTKSSVLIGLADTLRNSQEVFNKTGGLHASAIFDNDGKLLYMREDVGRHNALDKVIGYAFQNNLLPLSNCILLLSGRISFELVQKAAVAGIAIIAAIGAPSSLAVQLGTEQNLTLIGFLRGNNYNIYCGSQRIID